MKNGSIEFEKLGSFSSDYKSKGNILPGYEHISIHMIFEIKMGGTFNRKTILVSESNTTTPLSSTIKSTVVSR